MVVTRGHGWQEQLCPWQLRAAKKMKGNWTSCMGEGVKKEGTPDSSGHLPGMWVSSHAAHCSWASDKTPANLDLQAVCSWVPSELAREHTWLAEAIPGHGAAEFLLLTRFP